MFKKNTPPAYGVPSGPRIVAVQWNKSSPTGPNEFDCGWVEKLIFEIRHLKNYYYFNKDEKQTKNKFNFSISMKIVKNEYPI